MAMGTRSKLSSSEQDDLTKSKRCRPARLAEIMEGG